MQNRLAELKKFQQGGEASKGGSSKGGDVEMAETGPQSTFMAAYFKSVGEVKSSMGLIKANTDRIRKLKDKALGAALPEQEKKVSAELQMVIDETNKYAADVKQALKDMKDDNTTFETNNKGSSEARIRLNMHQTTTRKFQEYLKDYQEVQTDFKNAMKSKVGRQYKIVEPNATQEQVDEVVASGKVAEIFKSKLMEGGHEKLKNAVADIQDKYRDIRKLEQSVTELHQLFLDLALLVETQGELLDQIEYSVGQAKDYTKSAEKNLLEAKEYQKSSRKKICCGIVIMIVILFVMLGPIFKVLPGSA